MLLICLSISTFILTSFTVLSITPFSHWTVRITDFPRFQIAILIFLNILFLISVIIFTSTSHIFYYGLIGINVICLSYQLWWILPYTPIWPIQVPKASQTKASISILSSNVYGPNKNHDDMIRIIRRLNPDIVITLESNQRWQNALSVITDTYPHQLLHPLENLYGMHIYSKLPLKDTSIRMLVEEDVPSMTVKISPQSSPEIKLYVVHPAPPSPTENETSEERDEELLRVALEIQQSNIPSIITGDLNDVAWSKTTRQFRKITQLLDPRIGRGMFNTFHAQYPLLRWPLDHLFHSKHFELIQIKRIRLKGSDHFALFTNLSITEKKP